MEANNADEQNKKKLGLTYGEISSLYLTELRRSQTNLSNGGEIFKSNHGQIVTSSGQDFRKGIDDFGSDIYEDDMDGGRNTGLSRVGISSEGDPSDTYANMLKARGSLQHRDSLHLLMSQRIGARRGAIFTNVFEDDAENGFFYELDEGVIPDETKTEAVANSNALILKVCQDRYARACKQLKISPATRILALLKSGVDCIDLKGLQITAKGLNAVCAALLEHQMIRRLDLSDNGLGASYLSNVSMLLEQNDHITELVLSNNKLSGDGIHLLSKMFKENNSIKYLDISGNSLKDKDEDHIAEIIKSGSSITNLKVNRNELHDKAGAAIGKAIATNRNIKILDLSWNHLRSRGAEALAAGLLKNDTLCLLDVSWNGFGFEGCGAIAHALCHNTTLHHLNMESNRIHPPALFALTKGLVLNRGLHTLKIGKNPITAKCATPFLMAIREAEEITLTVLDLNGVVVDTQFEDVLSDLVEERPIQVYYDRSLPVHKNRNDIKQARGSRSLVFNIDPIQILFHLKRNLRNVDFFRLMDKDKDATLSRKEIRQMLQRNGYPISIAGMDVIMEYLDSDNDGQVDLAEFSNGQRKHRRANLDEESYNNRATSKVSSTFQPDALKGFDS